ncbi:MAG: sigma 54-interacting transcriptional regulator [Deltaproteobacteria bacterium]|nr:sigma 54-interacting transcriptional regulator [Deltaproteobacteria bacterium]
MPIRALLWIGRARDFAGDLIADAPSLDVTWERNVELALTHSFDALDAVVLDVDDEPSGRRDLERLSCEWPGCPVIVRVPKEAGTEPGDWLEAGAVAVLPSELRAVAGAPSRQLRDCIEQVVLARSGRPAPKHRKGRGASPFPAIIGESPEMRRVFALIERAGRSRATVLVSGETGTGKELIARAIHDCSARREQAFVGFNCAAFPESLLESELYGHAKGAFTGANREKPGLVETADRGTLFLDEISETSGPFQAKLLRVLQEREVRAVGSTKSRQVDVRVIAASNRDLLTEVQQGRFREDLYYRLAVFPIHVPALRERPSDVGPLAEFFLALHGRREHKARVVLSEDAVQQLATYGWPGNVRELENEIQREPGESLRESMQRLEALMLRRALKVHRGRRAATARSLGITREGLYKKLKRLNIE